MGLVDLITVSHWYMKRLHDGPVDRVEESRHFGLSSSLNSIDSDQWHGVILLLYSISASVFGTPREMSRAMAPFRILHARYRHFTGLEFLYSPVPVCLGHINIAFGTNRHG
jgi:hypothetical protein